VELVDGCHAYGRAVPPMASMSASHARESGPSALQSAAVILAATRGPRRGLDTASLGGLSTEHLVEQAMDEPCKRKVGSSGRAGGENELGSPSRPTACM
jgi:hypothetical protein